MSYARTRLGEGLATCSIGHSTLTPRAVRKLGHADPGRFTSTHKI